MILKKNVVHYTDQQENFLVFYRMQKETESVVSISETFEKNGWDQCSVEVYQYFPEVDFYLLSVYYYLYYTDLEILDDFPSKLN